MVSQLRRAAASIPMNIAEGCGRGTDKDFGRFLQIAFGSASEVDYQLLLCRDLGFLESETYEDLDQLNGEVMKMLTALLRKLRTQTSS
jgi:four helix bundle protein